MLWSIFLWRYTESMSQEKICKSLRASSHSRIWRDVICETGEKVSLKDKLAFVDHQLWPISNRISCCKIPDFLQYAPTSQLRFVHWLGHQLYWSWTTCSCLQAWWVCSPLPLSRVLLQLNWLHFCRLQMFWSLGRILEGHWLQMYTWVKIASPPKSFPSSVSFSIVLMPLIWVQFCLSAWQLSSGL